MNFKYTIPDWQVGVFANLMLLAGAPMERFFDPHKPTNASCVQGSGSAEKWTIPLLVCTA